MLGVQGPTPSHPRYLRRGQADAALSLHLQRHWCSQQRHICASERGVPPPTFNNHQADMFRL